MVDGLGAPLAAPLFDRLALIGIGLIGSSLARVAKRKHLARTIVVSDASADVRAKAAELGLADEVAGTAGEAVSGADLVILCVPVGRDGVRGAGDRPASRRRARSSPTSAQSKSAVLAAMAKHLPKQVALIPAHPVAGTEESGPAAGFATLFVNRWCILTPPEDADAKAVKRLADFWTGGRRQCRSDDRRSIMIWCSRSQAICRI